MMGVLKDIFQVLGLESLILGLVTQSLCVAAQLNENAGWAKKAGPQTHDYNFVKS